jgi:hypothetical protein
MMQYCDLHVRHNILGWREKLDGEYERAISFWERTDPRGIDAGDGDRGVTVDYEWPATDEAILAVTIMLRKLSDEL